MKGLKQPLSGGVFLLYFLFLRVAQCTVTDDEPNTPMSFGSGAGSSDSEDTNYGQNLVKGTPSDPNWKWNSTGEAVLSADSRGAINCVGYYPIRFGRAHSAAEAGVSSLVEYCADAAYGGRMWRLSRNPSYNGAFCGFDVEPPQLLMSRQTGTVVDPTDWHFWLFCQAKCRCVEQAEEGSSDEAAGPETAPSASISEPTSPTPSPKLLMRSAQLIAIPRFGYTSADYQPNQVRHDIIIYSVPNSMTSPPLQFRTNSLRRAVVAGALPNELKCIGDRPEWLDVFGTPYSSNKELCSAVFLGGRPAGNVGGYCYDWNRNNFQFEEEFKAPLFAYPGPTQTTLDDIQEESDYDEDPDEELEVMTQRETQFVASLWCRVHCACATAQSNGVENQASNLVPGLGWANVNNGEFTFKQFPNPNNPNPQVHTLLARKPISQTTGSQNSESRRCTPTDKDPSVAICRERIPRSVTDLLGPAKTSSSDLNLDVSLPTCGSACTSNADCAKANAATSGSQTCRCVVSQGKEGFLPYSQTYSPVTGGVVRYALAAFCSVTSARAGLASLGTSGRVGLSSLGGGSLRSTGGRKSRRKRSGGLEVDEGEDDEVGHYGDGATKLIDEEKYVCVCNATYVSSACCGSGDGLVWEGAESKWGVVA